MLLPPAAAGGLAGSVRYVRQLELFFGQPYRGIDALLHSGHRSAVFPGDSQATLKVGRVVQKEWRGASIALPRSARTGQSSRTRNFLPPDSGTQPLFTLAVKTSWVVPSIWLRYRHA